MLESIQNTLFSLEENNFKWHVVDQMPQTSNENMQQASEPHVSSSKFIYTHVLLLKEHPRALFAEVLDVRSFSTWPLCDNSRIGGGDTLGSDMSTH